MMKIFDVVIGSNHFLIHPQTVGKNAGAPMIWEKLVWLVYVRVLGETYKNPVQSLGVMCSSKCAGILHVCSQIPKLLQSHTAYVHNIVALCDGRSWVFPVGKRCAKWHNEASQILVESEQADQFGRDGSFDLGFRFGVFGRFLVRVHSFGV